MSRDAMIEAIEQEQLKNDLPEFGPGDTIEISRKIVEGSKERIQKITGTVVARKGGGISETVSVYRIAYGSGMEMVFPLHGPRVTEIKRMRTGKVRRSKLYHIRGTFGKAAKIKELIGKKVKKTTIVEDKPAPKSEPSEPAAE
ncbi:MAG: 50S ribosomal protein L19 [Simkaniaceae bacterium]|nr:50S ribosomal protein L19 [Simkaniaceae bacterium]